MRFIVYAVLFAALARAQTGDPPLIDIPRVKGIAVDGESRDWKGRGYHVGIVVSANGATRAPADFDPTFRLGWDDRGLLVLCVVRDDSFTEKADKEAFGQGDSIEILFAPRVGAPDLIHATIVPGMGPDASEARYNLADWRTREPREPAEIQFGRARTDAGYAIEVLLPWSNHGITPERAVECALQIQFNDVDGEEKLFKAAWYPSTPASGRTSAMHRLQLSNRPDKPVRAIARGHFTNEVRTLVRVVTTNDWTGRTLTVSDSQRVLATATLKETNGRPSAEMLFDLPPVGESFDDLRVRAGRGATANVSLPDAAVWRAQRLITYPPRFAPPVFAGSGFPACNYEDPDLAERLIGPYRIAPKFYDAKYAEVSTAEAPGRYGAIMEIIPETGEPFRRYATLFRQPDSFNVFGWWVLKPTGSITFPAELGISDKAIDAQARAMGTFLQWQMQDAVAEDKDAAVLLAGLHETPADSEVREYYNDVFALDRQWWVGLKRKLNGAAAAYPNAIACPYPNSDRPATMLRNGTPEEAGFKPESIAIIDERLKAWAAASDEAFAVCLARNGVVFFERAYGNRFGEPMTVDKKSWMASISKFLSGALMMTLVDQGLVDLDAPIDTYLPALRGIPVKTPLTIRHCFTHTNGFQLGITPARMFNDHYGDELNDLEEVVAAYYPHLEVGTRHGYNGVGYAVAGKVIETVSGEALPQYFEKHFWGPLGCTHTDAIDMSARTMSIPRDIATFAQVMLNKGAYGNLRFFSQETFDKMLPVKLAPYVSFDAGDLQWGIGPVWIPGEGLSEKTFGHGAASAATLRIDPDSQLIVVMTRNAGGARFGEFHPQFMKNVSDGLVR
ncbi:MAG: serine hydrolase [Candidatus Hydrogenedentes bacterium]|nr:serine hydrolase [Candidatus Hydrogenedentota bacterium]